MFQSFQVLENLTMSNIIQNRMNKFALPNVLINKSSRVKTVASLLVGGMKCRGIKGPGITVAGRSVAGRKSRYQSPGPTCRESPGIDK